MGLILCMKPPSYSTSERIIDHLEILQSTLIGLANRDGERTWVHLYVWYTHLLYIRVHYIEYTCRLLILLWTIKGEAKPTAEG